MDCNLELGLLPFSTSGSNVENPRQEQMTIFYNGRICVCDVTDVQARSIISLASKKSRETVMCRSSNTNTIGCDAPISPTNLQSQKVYAQNDCNSMKRSLRQFLEKRKHRVQSLSPYHR